jgi:hypothetical protein|tara:strand:- start:343 stop:1167 length:825 start_codon:yes stop_codon:yes gene_type:complete
MAKKAKIMDAPVIEHEAPTVKETIKKPTKPQWEIKDRNYFLTGAHNPLTYTIPSRHTTKVPLLWFDSNNNEQKELKYATNQSSPFANDHKGEATLGHIIFKEGTLTVPKEKQNLQKLLSLYHPKLNVSYTEFDAVEEAKDELDDLEMQIDALNAAKNIDIDHGEAILRVELGSQVTTMSSKEIRRDLLLFAKRKPDLFLDLAADDNVELRNTAIVAQENGIIKLSQDQRTFMWASNDKKLMTIPFDENPYSAMAAFFKTDEGTEVFKSIEKKLK